MWESRCQGAANRYQSVVQGGEGEKISTVRANRPFFPPSLRKKDNVDLALRDMV